jgi:hypothetical protein
MIEYAFIFPFAIITLFVVLIVWWAIQGDTGP